MKSRQTRILFAGLAMAGWLASGFGAAACGDDGDDDGTAADAALADAAPIDGMPADADTRRKLSGEGLYQDIATLTIAAEALEYEPVAELWSDGAVKRRWIILPPGTTIDTSDMDHWRFPTGTKIFKEFAAPDGTRLETRLIEKTGAGDEPTDFFACAFVWFADGSDAACTPGGAENVLGTEHDVPNSTRCFSCHKGETGKVLGFSAMQLSKPGVGAAEVTLSSLAADGLLSNPPPAGTEYPFPGATQIERDAMGYFHANCAHCHNPLGPGYTDSCANDGMGNYSECQILRLDVAESALPVAQSKLYLSTVGQVTHYYPGGTGGQIRIAPGNPDGSVIYTRINQRGSMEQMPPPFSTEVVDTAGVAIVRAWIESL
jgi:hypothetical protein